MKKAIKDGVHGFTLALLKELESGDPLFVKHHNLAIEKERDGPETPGIGAGYVSILCN